MKGLAASLTTMTEAWTRISERYAAYRLALPGDPVFVCQPDVCDAHCCRAFTVNLGEREALRMEQTSRLPRPRFLECEDGVPLALPMAQPYILSRDDGHCSLLAHSLACSQYEGRPNACRLYPHFVLFIDPASGRPVHGDVDAISRSFRRLEMGDPLEPLVPLLLRHVECPGFTGPPMSEDDWARLCRETFALQYEAPEDR